MPPTTITIDSEYGYVILAAASTFLMNMVHGGNTGKYRKAAKIPYPAPYASNEAAATDVKAYQFNCAQRSHANFTENHTSILASLLIAGVRFPVASAVLGLAWSVNRYLYMVGYCGPDVKSSGKGRYWGAGQYFSILGLLGLSIYSGYKMIVGA